MKRIHNTIIASLLAASSLAGFPALASGLLGGGLGGGTSTGNLVTVQSGPASDNGLVNVGVLGGGGNIADVKIGGAADSIGSSDPLAQVNVSSGGSNGLLDVDANLGGLTTAGVDIGGTGGLGVDVEVGGLGTPGAPGLPGEDGAGGGNTYGFFGSNGGSYGANCVGPDGRKLLNFAARQAYSSQSFIGWNHATNIRLVAVRLCPAARDALARALTQSGNIQGLQTAAAADGLINASLVRAHSAPNHVLAVTQKGAALDVYVY